MPTRKPISKEKALERLETLCSRSEQCESDLINKLFNWGINAFDRKEIIEYLKENRYLDNERFARAYTNDKARFSAWGPYKIRMELIKKKIPNAAIKNAIADVPSEVWKEGLLKCATSKAKNLDLVGEDGTETARENRQKLYRYIVTRGFPSSAASKAVNYLISRQKGE